MEDYNPPREVTTSSFSLGLNKKNTQLHILIHRQKVVPQLHTGKKCKSFEEKKMERMCFQTETGDKGVTVVHNPKGLRSNVTY